MTQQTYQVKGMHCASCASIIERTLKKVEGVQAIEVNPGTETAKISFDAAKTDAAKLSSMIEPVGYSLVAAELESAKAMGMSEGEHAAHLGLSQTKGEKLAELAEMRTKLFLVLPLAVFSILVMGWDMLAQSGLVPMMPQMLQAGTRYLLAFMALGAFVLVGRPYVLGLWRFVRYGAANMDTLIGLGTLSAFVYSVIVTVFAGALRPFLNVDNTYFDVTIVVLSFITLGKYFETRSKLKTGDAIEKLLNLQAKTALVMRDGAEVEVPIEQVVHGDMIVVKPAGRIPVDGVIAEGSSFVDESMITGEPMPVKKAVGDKVAAGTLNTTGAFVFAATGVGAETMLARIVRMVADAQGSRAPIQALADKISSVFVPTVLVLAIGTLAGWLVFGAAHLGFSQALSYGLLSFVGILVIACPCALGLATPTAIIVGVGKGAREGILIKDAATLETLGKVDVVVVDKTGTLTKGKPELVSVRNFSGRPEDELVAILASLEKKSEHPIAHAVVSAAEVRGLSLSEVKDFEVLKGRGLRGAVGGVMYFAGNAKLVAELGLAFDAASLEQETLEGKTPIILATKNAVLGVIMIADAVKPEAVEAVVQLHKLGIRVVMLTGDDRNTAMCVARKIGLNLAERPPSPQSSPFQGEGAAQEPNALEFDEVVAEVLPEDKLAKVRELQAAGKIVAMAGDGINDAPALAAADVGIAMATGTDVAIETAGITLLHGDISKLVKAVKLSRMTMRGIRQNLFWAFFYNVVGIPLAGGWLFPLTGWLVSPMFAGLAMAFSSVSVVGNSLRLKNKAL